MRRVASLDEQQGVGLALEAREGVGGAQRPLLGQLVEAEGAEEGRALLGGGAGGGRAVLAAGRPGGVRRRGVGREAQAVRVRRGGEERQLAQEAVEDGLLHQAQLAHVGGARVVAQQPVPSCRRGCLERHKLRPLIGYSYTQWVYPFGYPNGSGNG